MKTLIFDGKSFASQKEQKLIEKMPNVKRNLGRSPKLLAVGVGEETDVAMYLALKEKAATRIGFDFEKKIFPLTAKQGEIEKQLLISNQDPQIDSILLELPLPQTMKVTSLTSLISPVKDHDCITPQNLGLFLLGRPRYYPATVRAIKDIVAYYFYRLLNSRIKETDFLIENKAKPLAKKNAVVIGGGIELGKPLALLFSDLGAAVSLCRSTTKDLSQFTKEADLIVSAAGVPGLLKGEMIREGALVIDAGINFINGKTSGDVDFESVKEKSAFLTPVPGGVGPVTIMSLFENIVESII
ncbi:bifunctional 5,10-methylenetetrahydrofolate dehydrogenase/5,10-methenyltetrahydrofolate cyclohydrolase [Candidatus Microgenomates bacterium]|nr:bifunctional 5,10-methylenetetrahydrofolate dehydrogenase/5,10-methenyltetrahydrofolate cyclohydrolase [Candidatus Microgenomates bacterium]